MFYIKKRLEVAGEHKLTLDYESKCQNLHGHNWIIEVECKSEKLNQNGMLVDFTHIKKAIHERLDHKYINDIVDFNPTAENIAKWVVENVPLCFRAKVIESENNEAVYEI